jgi:hypothetical protein
MQWLDFSFQAHPYAEYARVDDVRTQRQGLIKSKELSDSSCGSSKHRKD